LKTVLRGAVENGDLLTAPDAPRELLLIGNTDQAHIGIVRVGACGELVPPQDQSGEGSSVWASFRQLAGVLGILPRGMAFEPGTGDLWVSGRSDADSVLYTVGPGGGNVGTVAVSGERRSSQVGGAIAFDGNGRMYEADLYGAVSMIEGSSLHSTPYATKLALAGVTLGPILDLLVVDGALVGRANQQLLATSNGDAAGQLYAIDLVTHVADVLMTLPGTRLNRLTVDASGAIWLGVNKNADGTDRVGVTRVTFPEGHPSTTDFFVPIIEGISGVLDSEGNFVRVDSPTGIAVFGNALTESIGDGFGGAAN
jgi:hypothetical protein